MDNKNLTLFKQAIREGLNDKFDNVVNSYIGEIVCSEKHNLAIRTIIYGKSTTKRNWPSRKKRLVAILIAVSLLLTSCGIIFRNEIRDILEDVCDFFIAVTYTEQGSDGEIIEEVYELGYLPNGYSLSNENIRPLRVHYEFINENGDYIWFEQKTIDGTDFVIDNEDGYSHVKEIETYDIYYKYMNKKHIYIWNDGKYSIFIRSNLEINPSEIILMINGLRFR